MEKIVGIEFFSGIGGLHYGLEYACKEAEIVAAFDINTNANKVYKYNFNLTPSTKGIDRLTADFVDKFKANLWLLSPPCQPFTAGGKRLDHEDLRSAALLNLIKLLGNVAFKPSYVFVENVPNFEISECRRLLVDQLTSLGFVVDEFLVSPLLVGIPNNRKRYYLAAKFLGEGQGQVNTLHLDLSCYCPDYTSPSLRPLSDYLDSSINISEYLVSPENIRKRTNFEFDVVQPNSPFCSTFTKAYGGHHFFGSGSILQTKNLETPFKQIDNDLLISVEPRYFTPTEIAKLHYFINDNKTKHKFSFPEDLNRIQKYKLLGNSLNVKIVGVLLRSLFNRKSNLPSPKKLKTNSAKDNIFS